MKKTRLFIYLSLAFSIGLMMVNFTSFVWVVSLLASLGSLFFSEIMGLTPCTLCWYQRIAMYPLVIMSFQALIKNKKDLSCYVGPFISIGWLLAFYHNLLIWKIIQPELAPCQYGIPCNEPYIQWGGFISIALLSLLAFSLLGVAFIMKRGGTK